MGTLKNSSDITAAAVSAKGHVRVLIRCQVCVQSIWYQPAPLSVLSQAGRFYFLRWCLRAGCESRLVAEQACGPLRSLGIQSTILVTAIPGRTRSHAPSACFWPSITLPPPLSLDRCRHPFKLAAAGATRRLRCAAELSVATVLKPGTRLFWAWLVTLWSPCGCMNITTFTRVRTCPPDKCGTL
jgi:hypothetical protein